MSLIQPGDLPTSALQHHEHDHDVGGALKKVVERHRASNEKEHERLSLDRMRKTIRLTYPDLSDSRIEDIMHRQLRPASAKASVRPEGLTARDLMRETRKAGVKARRRCRG